MSVADDQQGSQGRKDGWVPHASAGPSSTIGGQRIVTPVRCAIRKKRNKRTTAACKSTQPQ